VSETRAFGTMRWGGHRGPLAQRLSHYKNAPSDDDNNRTLTLHR